MRQSITEQSVAEVQRLGPDERPGSLGLHRVPAANHKGQLLLDPPPGARCLRFVEEPCR